MEESEAADLDALRADGLATSPLPFFRRRRRRGRIQCVEESCMFCWRPRPTSLPILGGGGRARQAAGSTRTAAAALRARRSMLLARQEAAGCEGEVVVISNGPGELAAWVQPFVASLRSSTAGAAVAVRAPRTAIRVSVLFAPCPHASGKEVEAARHLLEEEEGEDPGNGSEIYLQPAPLLWRTILSGQPAASRCERTWGSQGVVVHLGGEQLYSVPLAARKGWPCIMYVEDAVRWSSFATYAVRDPSVLGSQKDPSGKIIVIGDLMQDALIRKDGTQGRSPVNDIEDDTRNQPASGAQADDQRSSSVLTIGVLFGSKGVKLRLGVPYFAATAKAIVTALNKQTRADSKRVRFVAPLAPTVSVDDVRKAAAEECNDFAGGFGCSTAVTCSEERPERAVLIVDDSVRIELWPGGRAHYNSLDLALTTAGTNTAELGHMAIPMIVVLPTFELALFQAAGGVLGLLGKVPGGLGKVFLRVANAAYLETQRPLAWPNKWAKRSKRSSRGAPLVVPELVYQVGEIEPEEAAAVICEYILDEEKLASLKSNLSAASEEERKGVAHMSADLSPSQRLAQIVLDALSTASSVS